MLPMSVGMQMGPSFDLSPGQNTHVGIPAPLYQPSPVRAPVKRHASTSPSLATSLTHTLTSTSRHEYGGASDEGRMSISIDFGNVFFFLPRGILRRADVLSF